MKLKSLFITFALCFVANVTMASDWLELSKEMSIDIDHLTYEGKDVATCWIRYNNNKPKYLSNKKAVYQSGKFFYRINHLSRTTETLDEILYSGRNGSGDVVWSYHNKYAEAESIVPDTNGEILWQFLFKSSEQKGTD
ncbi:MAG: surface-adhesin E family protein [Chlorobiaceae bacterium]